MKKIALYLSLLTLAGMVLPACSLCTKKTNCPAYDNPALFPWFTYIAGQQDIFIDSAGQKDTMTIGEVNKSVSYTLTQTTGYNSKMEFCKSSLKITSTEKHKLYISQTTEGDLPPQQSVDLNFMYFELGITPTDSALAYSFRDTAIWKSTLQGNYRLGSHTYDKLQIFTTTDTAAAAKAKLDKLYIAKGHGVVCYETYPDKTLWWLQ